MGVVMAYTAYGFDYTGGLNAATIDRATIDGHQVSFVCRYLSGFSKDLTSAEAKALSAAGISVVVVWETTATRAEDGHAAGVADARAALAEAKRCGMPDGRPIYFAVDEDTTVGPHVTAYFQGAASVLGLARTGAYGSYHVIKGLFDANLITWAWQTYAWSGGVWDLRAHIQQYSNDHTIGGHGVDYDRATKQDYGQWRVGVTPTPTPQPHEEEIDMAQRDLLPGLTAKSGLGMPPKTGGYSFVEFYTDNSYTDGKDIKPFAPVSLRVVIRKANGTWQHVEPFVVGRADKDTDQKQWRIPLEDKNSTYVSVTRLSGDGSEELQVAAY